MYTYFIGKDLKEMSRPERLEYSLIQSVTLVIQYE